MTVAHPCGLGLRVALRLLEATSHITFIFQLAHAAWELGAYDVALWLGACHCSMGPVSEGQQPAALSSPSLPSKKVRFVEAPATDEIKAVNRAKLQKRHGYIAAWWCGEIWILYDLPCILSATTFRMGFDFSYGLFISVPCCT